MIAIDTNILIYSHRSEFVKEYPIANKIIQDLCEGSEPWVIPWPCVYEFIRVVTHPKFLNPPTSNQIVLENIQQLYQSPSLVLIQETERHLNILTKLIEETGMNGNLIFDVRVAALLIEHGVSEILTADHDFLKFDSYFKVTNPFKNPG